MTGVVRTPGARVDTDAVLGNHESRLRDLERNAPTPTGAGRVVYGAVYNDGNVIDVGSNDWTCTWDGMHTYTIDISPPLDGLPVAYGLTANNNNPSGSGPGRYIVSLSAREADGSQVTVITQDADDPDELTDQDGGFDFAFVAGGGAP